MRDCDVWEHSTISGDVRSSNINDESHGRSETTRYI
jgi:hypothetical protein